MTTSRDGRSGSSGANASRPWSFEYAPASGGTVDDDGHARSLVVATRRPAPRKILCDATGAVVAMAAFEHAPLFWYRLDFDRDVVREDVAAAVERAGIEVRYVASFACGSTALGLPFGADGADSVDGDERAQAVHSSRTWRTRSEPVAPETSGHGARSEGGWFLDEHAGVNVTANADRRSTRRVHDGRGTRLAVIDDDAASADELSLDAEIAVGIPEIPRSQMHGSLMVAWAVGACGARPMAGVAPSASPRLYVIPKPGTEVLSLAVAFARAVLDGADVVVCSTYVEGANSPMLSDAFAFARRYGRGGLGTALVLPTGREASSPSYAARASWSLSLADPACDARVFCIAPGGKNGGWFTWKDRRGKWHPFANRGPSVRWLAPGDDIAYPFGAKERSFHAESSGAAAIAAGVLLCIIGSCPGIHADELDAVVTRTAARVDHSERAELHPGDAAPLANDADGHSAKHGYGRMNARAACALVTDPVAGALVTIGDDDTAARWLERRDDDPDVAALYSSALGAWMARAALADSGLTHALRTLVRHVRLVVARPERAAAQVDGALLRHLVLCAEAALFSRCAPKPPVRVRRELELVRDLLLGLAGRARSTHGVVAFESSVLALAHELFLGADDSLAPRHQSETRLRAVAAQELAAAEDPDDGGFDVSASGIDATPRIAHTR